MLRHAPVVCVAAALCSSACHRPPPREQTQTDQAPPQPPDALFTAAQVAELEAALAKDPDQLFQRERLLYIYTVAGDRLFGREAAIQARRKHIFWLIEHHPDSKPARSPQARIFTQPGDPDPDPEGYQKAKKMWLAKTAPPDTPVSILSAAGRFFRINDRPLAEQVYLRAKAKDPNGHWSQELGRIYYEALVGATAINMDNSIRTNSLSLAHSPYATAVRRELDDSKDQTILAVTGNLLGLQAPALYQNHQIDFDPVALSKTYLNHAVQLDPNAIFVHQTLLTVLFQERGGVIPNVPSVAFARERYQKLSALPESQRFFPMSLLAFGAFALGDANSSARVPALEIASKAARESLQLAAKYPADPDYGTAIFTSTSSLGLLALRSGDRRGAVSKMLEAANAPATQELQYTMNDFTLMLPERLYQAGERSTVIDFLERFAQTQISARGYLQESAKAIRANQKPLWVPK